MRTSADPTTTTTRRSGPSHRPVAAHGRPGGLVLLYAVYALAIAVAAAGVGLAVPRLGEQGMVTGAWVGLGLVAGGLAVSGWAAWRALHAVRRRWWPPESGSRLHRPCS